MKRIISFIVLTFMILSVLVTCGTAFAEDAGDNITIDVSVPNASFRKNTPYELSYTITNSGSITGAKEYLYLDGILVSDANPNYFMIFSSAKRKVAFSILPELPPVAAHTMKIEVQLKDGRAYEKTFPVTIDEAAGSVEMNFAVYSQSVEVGGVFSCGVQFWFPLSDVTYAISTAISVNGVRLNELGESLSLKSGDIWYFNVPGQYATEDMYKYKFELTANPSPMPGEGTKTISVEVPVNSELARSGAYIDSLVKPVIITAYVKSDTSGYLYASLTGYCTTIPKGSYVAYLNPDNHNSMRAAKVRTSWGGVYWVRMSDIYITTGDYVIADNLTPQQKEVYVNYKGYDSKTAYLIWVNLERQILTVFMGSKGNWSHLATFPVASGKNNTPTPTVQHEIAYVTRWVTPTYTCSPVLSLYDGYAIHNQPVSPSGYVTDKTIGRPASAGCVRMLQKDIDWVRSVVPVKTNVVIY